MAKGRLLTLFSLQSVLTAVGSVCVVCRQSVSRSNGLKQHLPNKTIAYGKKRR